MNVFGTSGIVGIGIDLVDVGPLRRSLARYGSRILVHFFTTREISDGSKERDAAGFFAGRFAVKEAAFKALGTGWRGAISWRDVEVDRSWRPASLALTGEFARLAEERGVKDSRVALSTPAGVASAVVLLIG
jgi:holo-[acyl-carrier protein] synthase